MKIECRDCKRTPDQIQEYVEMVESGEYASEDQAVKCNEGTYNPTTGKFLCTECYIKAGMPLGLA